MSMKKLAILGVVTILAPLAYTGYARAGGISPGAAVGIGVGSLLLGGLLAGQQPAYGQGYGYSQQQYYQPQQYGYDYGYQQPGYDYGYQQPEYGYDRPQYQQYYTQQRRGRARCPRGYYLASDYVCYPRY
ncbi:MAG: hypothetical protein M3Z96_13535 [Pseudomonadota bacterium]|nr:hypothetical protein [Pseudomonadota bacterium]